MSGKSETKADNDWKGEKVEKINRKKETQKSLSQLSFSKAIKN